MILCMRVSGLGLDSEAFIFLFYFFFHFDFSFIYDRSQTLVIRNFILYRVISLTVSEFYLKMYQ